MGQKFKLKYWVHIEHVFSELWWCVFDRLKTRVQYWSTSVRDPARLQHGQYAHKGSRRPLEILSVRSVSCWAWRFAHPVLTGWFFSKMIFFLRIRDHTCQTSMSTATSLQSWCLSECVFVGLGDRVQQLSKGSCLDVSNKLGQTPMSAGRKGQRASRFDLQVWRVWHTVVHNWTGTWWGGEPSRGQNLWSETVAGTPGTTCDRNP